MKFNRLNQTHIRDLQSMVAPDRFSTGESNLDLHAKDQSHHKPSRPEAVIWPEDATSVVDCVVFQDPNLTNPVQLQTRFIEVISRA